MDKPVIRDATVKDLKGMIKLVSKLAEYEEGLSNDSLLVEDADERRVGITDSLAQALVNPDYKTLVVEKSGRLIGVFLAYMTYMPSVFKRDKLCHIWMGYTSKPILSLNKVRKKLMEWGKDKGCNGYQVYILAGNKKLHRFCEKIGAEKVYYVYEKGV